MVQLPSKRYHCHHRSSVVIRIPIFFVIGIIILISSNNNSSSNNLLRLTITQTEAFAIVTPTISSTRIRRITTTKTTTSQRPIITNNPTTNNYSISTSRSSRSSSSMRRRAGNLLVRCGNTKEDETTTVRSPSSEEECLVGENVVDQCEVVDSSRESGGGQSKSSASINLAKCICGAGSFALPHVFLEEGLLGGTLALTICGLLANWTMHSLANSKFLVSKNNSNSRVTSYVELARATLGEPAAKLVFALTLSASIGVCSTYLVFIGSTLESMSNDVVGDNIVRQLWPNVSEMKFEMVAAAILFPLSLVRDYSIFAFTSALGVIAVVGGIAVTLAYGIFVNPGGGLSVAVLESIPTLPMWPSSVATAFGGSFGTICYLFAINFLTFPVINSMAQPQRDYNGAVSRAVAGVWLINIIFSIIALGFYREDTQDLILANLDNGPYLSALKLLLCVDLLFTFPIVFSSGRQILENAILSDTISSEGEEWQLPVKRAGIVAGAVTTCFGMAQIGGFGAVANLVGGVAQGTLAFIMPPAIAISLSQKYNNDDDDDNDVNSNNNNQQQQQHTLFLVNQYATATFGIIVVSAVTYFTFTSI